MVVINKDFTHNYIICCHISTERFIHNLLEAIFSVVSSTCIQCLRVVHIFGGHNRRNLVVILEFFKEALAKRNSRREALVICFPLGKFSI